jgi:hypothetical protein
MARTFRVKNYENGRTVYTKYESQESPINRFRHENPKCRRHLNRSRRMKTKAYFERTREVLNIGNTNGWETW